MRAGPAALCEGTVWHRRNRPAVNEFTYSVSHVWIDPDHPEEIAARSRLWSASGRAPARFRRKDYGLRPEMSLGEEIRSAVEPLLGHSPAGPVRMLSQIRRWGWLFNPITLFLVWDEEDGEPVAAVAEVTNTPWKERTQYPVLLARSAEREWSTRFAKTLHVSPFLGENFDYELRVVDNDPCMEVTIDVCAAGVSEAIVQTAVRVERLPPTAVNLRRTLFRHALSTRRVSVGIHAQAMRLGRKRVPFVSHPKRHSATKG